MAVLTGELKRAFLNALTRQAGESAELKDVLTGFQDFCFEPSLKRGRLLTHSAGNAHSTAFQAAMNNLQLTQEQVFSLSQEFLDTYQDATINLSAQGVSSPTDEQVLAEMFNDDRLASIDTVKRDYTTARLWANRY